MTLKNEFRKGRSCVFILHVHLVFVTKYPKKIFQYNHLEALKRYFEKVGEGFGVGVNEVNGSEDHVHILLNYPPTTCISKLVNSLKGVSSRLLKKDFPELSQFYWKGGLWSPSYFAASCGGAPISILKEYIENQSLTETKY